MAVAVLKGWNILRASKFNVMICYTVGLVEYTIFRRCSSQVQGSWIKGTRPRGCYTFALPPPPLFKLLLDGYHIFAILPAGLSVMRIARSREIRSANCGWNSDGNSCCDFRLRRFRNTQFIAPELCRRILQKFPFFSLKIRGVGKICLLCMGFSFLF